jgi:phage major head subunit gpT-like protein
MPMTSASFNRALELGINKWIGLGYKENPSCYSKIYEIRNSNKAYETDITSGGLGLMNVKTEGNDIAYDTYQQAFQVHYTHVVYALGLSITREAIEDNLYMELAEKRSKELGRSARETKEIVSTGILNSAFSATKTYADGLALASASHLIERGGTFSNTQSADFSEAALEQALIAIMEYKDSAGRRILVNPKQLIIPTALMFDVQRVLKSPARVGTADNDLNAVASFGLLQNAPVVNRHLTDADSWFIQTDVADGLIMYQRRALEAEQDRDFNSHNLLYQVSERYSVGVSDVKALFCSAGT